MALFDLKIGDVVVDKDNGEWRIERIDISDHSVFIRHEGPNMLMGGRWEWPANWDDGSYRLKASAHAASKCDCGGEKTTRTHSAWCSSMPTSTPPFIFDPTRRLF